MLTLIATPGASNANSYATVAEGDAYHEAHLYASAWTDADAATKAIALVMAARLLDSMYEWDQYRTSSEQALEWPRAGLLARNLLEYVDDWEIPPDLKNANAEFARQLLSTDRTADSPVETQGISSLSAGPVSLSFKDTVYPKVVPDAVAAFIPSWWGHLRGTGGRYDLERY